MLEPLTVDAPVYDVPAVQTLIAVVVVAAFQPICDVLLYTVDCASFAAALIHIVAVAAFVVNFQDVSDAREA